MSVGWAAFTNGARLASETNGAADNAPADLSSARRVNFGVTADDYRRALPCATIEPMRIDRRFAPARLLGLAATALVTALTSGLVSSATQAPQAPPAADATLPWGSWIEPDFPFFSSVLDAGRAGAGLPLRNLSPRAIVLNLGGGHWAAFDTDLLRVAAVWKGNGVTPRALAPGSYQVPDRKTQGGQTSLPEPDGTVWIATGIYPGWQSGERPSADDPREPAPTRDEVGRGPLPETHGRFKAVRFAGSGVVLEYTASGAEVRDWLRIAGNESGGSGAVVRQIAVGPSTMAAWLILGAKSMNASIASCAGAPPSVAIEAVTIGSETVSAVRLPPHTQRVDVCVVIADGPAPSMAAAAFPAGAPKPRWSQEVSTAITKSTAKEAFVVDDIALPVTNPWRRNVRPGDIQFLKDGTGVAVTLDGDVWIARGLDGSRGDVRWRRFTSGLHEPLSLAIRDDQIFVFDRNGVWRLRDTNGDGEADVHEMFSNAFAQTADNREFPSMIRLAPNGEFVIAKGGQEATTIGKHNGSVLRLSADGRTATVLGYGFRQPNIGVNPRTGLVTASDQQGHYIPTTPLHIVKGHQFYGFLSDKLPREVYPAPIAEPLTWIPHAVNASAMSQVWMYGARMGPLTDGLVHIGFNNPELLRVLLNERAPRLQAAVVSVTRGFTYPPLHGSVNPIDGQLYIAGFQVLGWGTTAKRLAGLGRVRYTGAPSYGATEVAATDRGVLVRFDVPLDASRATSIENYTVTAWNYQRTYRYGSPQFKADGSPGVDRLAPSSAYLSRDGRTVFIALPELSRLKPKPMQMRVGWSLTATDKTPVQDNAYFTPYELTPFDPNEEGFGDIAIDLSPKTLPPETTEPITAEEGRKLYQRFGCAACHASEANAVSKLGPNFNQLFGASRTFNGGIVRVTADEGYIRESILEPGAKVVAGYERLGMGMPSFAGVLTDAQIESIILFIKGLK
jgi:glucose/arabinose dehydrogenase/mono/diheme cytochrome c family protein